MRETTDTDLHLSFSQGLADNAVISRINGELWDLDRPLEQDCSLEILRFDNEDAQAVSTLKAVNNILILFVNTEFGGTQHKCTANQFLK